MHFSNHDGNFSQRMIRSNFSPEEDIIRPKGSIPERPFFPDGRDYSEMTAIVRRIIQEQFGGVIEQIRRKM